MDQLIQALKSRFGGQQQPALQPGPPQGNPWDDPAAVMKGMEVRANMPPGSGAQIPPVQDQIQRGVGATNPAGPATPVDEALFNALKRLQVNQAFAAGTGNPAQR